ncbi:oligopeptide/dipeptide ABC transporter ATP-binding protein [Breoghania sp.]|uniref:oligopeptide/dipeptide ABC transporter ATP-binding protein n=1 Tax=Breoghania sp. TaxID=2065378 RepID=UPI00261DC94D|nr:oligopeptide/dipeptide ABC transporter ATP-binding protein [Breoghania sp.]MDJ0933121.1 hypothetical protein [Breoghania sp.]
MKIRSIPTRSACSARCPPCAREGHFATIHGNVPVPIDFPLGCRFAPRCPFASPSCFTERPPMTNLGGGHSVACWYAPVEETSATSGGEVLA